MPIVKGGSDSAMDRPLSFRRGAARWMPAEQSAPIDPMACAMPAATLDGGQCNRRDKHESNANIDDLDSVRFEKRAMLYCRASSVHAGNEGMPRTRSARTRAVPVVGMRRIQGRRERERGNQNPIIIDA